MNSTQPNSSSPPESDLELLSAYLDKQLSVAERIHIERRMAAEPGLRVELESLRATIGALRDLEPARPPRSFTLDPAKVSRPRRSLPFAWVMQMGSGLAGLALVLLATVQMLSVGAMPAPAAEMSAKQAPAATEAPFVSAPQAPAADSRFAEPTQAPAATSASTSAPAADPAEAAMAAPTADIAAMVMPSPEVGNASATGGAAPPVGAAGGAPDSDGTADSIQSSESSSPGTTALPSTSAPVTAQPQSFPPGLTLAIGVALIGLAAAWYLAGRRKA